MYHEELFRGGKNKHTIYKHIKLKVNLAFRNAKNKTICILLLFFFVCLFVCF